MAIYMTLQAEHNLPRLTGKITEHFPVVVTSYEIVIADVKFLQRYHWKYVVVDEGHRLKNFNCKLLRELRTIPTANKLLLTGGVSCAVACCSCFDIIHMCRCSFGCLPDSPEPSSAQ